jgi:serine/threonine protein kinase
MTADPTPVIGEEDRKEAESLSLRPAHPPGQVPGYEVQEFLGRGAFGEVWLAEDRNTGRRVAIKFYTHRGGLDWSLLSREVEKLRFLFGDRHVVQLITVGWDANPPYYVMEHLERGSLESLLQEGPLPVDRALEMFRDVAEGLRHAHGKGILHCDLKPANVLLDDDMRPRLADFGQARLTHEHSAALGTVYYMAPEQADLGAAPDARWDVYALGALMYRMLTGEPPHRSESLRQDLAKGATLKERLARYRQLIQKAPPPSAHRKVRGVDRALAEIIDRCLAKKPDKRFPTVDAVLAALQARALRRARRPLLVLGVVGPILLLVLVAFFAWRAFTDAVEGSKDSLTQYTLQSNRLAAKHVAKTVAQGIRRRWGILRRAASDKDLHQRLKGAAGPIQDNKIQALEKRLDELFVRHYGLENASAWFLVDAEGRLLAISPQERRESVKTLEVKPGKSLRDREYFHGKREHFEPDDPRVKNLGPATVPQLSTVIKSRLGKHPRIVIFSVPVTDGGRKPIGVLGMSVELGQFHELQSDDRASGTTPGNEGGYQTGGFATLVDTRKDYLSETDQPGLILQLQRPFGRLSFFSTGQPGLILQHPQLEHMAAQSEELPPVRLSPEQVQDLQKLVDQEKETDLFLPAYRDPFGKDHQPYQGKWLVVARPVRFESRSPPTGQNVDHQVDDVRTKWVVLVQEKYADVIEPVGKLQSALVKDGLLALALTLTLMAGLWAFVILVLSDSARNRLSAFLRRRARLSGGTLSTQSGSLSARSGSLSGSLPQSEGTASGDVANTRPDEAKKG